MPYEMHDWIESVPPENVVWRFMSLDKYLSMIGTHSLFFAKSLTMMDTWEGVRGRANFEVRPHLYGEHFEGMNKVGAWSTMDSFRNATYLNCWHQSEIESAAMWSLYASDDRGVAVKTTWGALTESITDPETIVGGTVQYVDYDTYFIPENLTYSAFLHKRQSFEHEKEVRLLFHRFIISQNPDGSDFLDLDAESPAGFPVGIDFGLLDPTIFVSPMAAPWFCDVVASATAAYGLPWEVVQSSLYSGVGR